MENCIAIITARGGSKRIPKKNIKEFLGVPLLKYTIDAALNAGCFDEIMVSTEDSQIAELARELGANVPFLRSALTSNDYATTSNVIDEVLNKYSKRGQEFKYCCCLYPSPFISELKLKEAYGKFITSGADSLVPVVQFNHPILRSFKIEGGLVKMNWPEYIKSRSQDLPPAFHDCGQFYFFKTDTYKLKKIFTDFTVPFEMPESEVHDIDTEEDWKVAEIKYTLFGQKKTEFIKKAVLLKKIKNIYENGGNVIEYLKTLEGRDQNDLQDILISYDLQAGSYINGYLKKDRQQSYSNYLSFVINQLGSFESIIEVGVGEATTLGTLLRYIRKPQYIMGFDISWSRLRYAKAFMEASGFHDTMLFISNLFQIALPDNSVDIVYTSHSIEANGGKEEQALRELYRITRKFLVLLEPAYEYASQEGKERMIKHGYITRLFDTATKLGYKIIEHRLFDTYVNPLNPTGLIVIEKIDRLDNPVTPVYYCPISKSVLEKHDNVYYSNNGLLAYPIISDIPCLSQDNAIIATHFLDDFDEIIQKIKLMNTPYKIKETGSK